MKRILSLVFIFGFLTHAHGAGYGYNDLVKQLVKEAKAAKEQGKKLSDILVVIRVNGVLLQPKNPAFDYGAMTFHKKYMDEFLQRMSDTVACQVYTYGMAEKGFKEIEPKFKNLIGQLQTQNLSGIKVVAIEMVTPGDVGDVKKVGKKVSDELKNRGYPFHKSFPGRQDFKDVNDYNKVSSAIEDGVIMTNEIAYTKSLGESLVAFLKNQKGKGWSPSVILGIDADVLAVTEMGAAVGKYNPKIKFVKLPANPPPGSLVYRWPMFKAWDEMLTTVLEKLADEKKG